MKRRPDPLLLIVAGLVVAAAAALAMGNRPADGESGPEFQRLVGGLSFGSTIEPKLDESRSDRLDFPVP